jgi:hypothetical protein
MRDLEDQGIVLRDRLAFTEIRDRRKVLRRVNLVGWIECAEDVRVRVDKWLDVRRGVRGRYEVRGRYYDYHAMRGAGAPLLRYDNAHGPEALHRHRFNPHSGRDVVEQISREELPTLDHVILEAIDAARIARGRGPL